MKEANILREQTKIEEFLNCLTHGFGAILSLFALKILISKAILIGGLRGLVSSLVYGMSLFLLYLFSSLYHGIQHPKFKRVFRFFDHSSIYIMIIGSYTPFCLFTLRGKLGLVILALLWILAISGLLLKASYTSKSYLIYLIMGWLMVIAAKPLISNLCFSGLMWLFAGGLFYSFGVIFYSKEMMPYAHVIWHFFVMGGSICHFLAILLYVLPR